MGRFPGRSETRHEAKERHVSGFSGQIFSRRRCALASACLVDMSSMEPLPRPVGQLVSPPVLVGPFCPARNLSEVRAGVQRLALFVPKTPQTVKLAIGSEGGMAGEWPGEGTGAGRGLGGAEVIVDVFPTGMQVLQDKTVGSFERESEAS
jgi:hypothetical protein